LQALGRNISNMSAFNDFAEADEILNITNSTDSINISYTLNSSVRKTATFEIYDTNISYVPVINSTINDAFITGILWDYSDGGDEYDKTQDLIFITKLNKTQEGKYGIYDYEIRVPSNLKKYKTGSGLISFYTEIN